MPDNLNVADILNLVMESNKEFESQIFIPSLQKEIHAKPMNASHLKSILKTSVSGVFANNGFNQTTFVMLKEILDPSVPTSQINVLDKVAILLQLRKLNGKSSVDVEVTSGEVQRIVQVDLSHIIDKIKNSELDFTDAVAKAGNIEVTINYPSLDQEFLFDRNFETNRMKKLDENNKEAVKELLGPLFIKELTQYIKTLQIGDNLIDFLKLSADNRLAIVEKLPSSVITNIIDTIDVRFGKPITEILTVEMELDGLPFKGSISVGSNLFT